MRSAETRAINASRATSLVAVPIALIRHLPQHVHHSTHNKKTTSRTLGEDWELRAKEPRKCLWTENSIVKWKRLRPSQRTGKIFYQDFMRQDLFLRAWKQTEIIEHQIKIFHLLQGNILERQTRTLSKIELIHPTCSFSSFKMVLIKLPIICLLSHPFRYITSWPAICVAWKQHHQHEGTAAFRPLGLMRTQLTPLIMDQLVFNSLSHLNMKSGRWMFPCKGEKSIWVILNILQKM